MAASASGLAPMVTPESERHAAGGSAGARGPGKVRIGEKLWRAVTVGDSDKVEVLLRVNSAIRTEVSQPQASQQHRSLLMQAAARGHWHVLEMLLECATDVNAVSIKTGNNALHECMPGKRATEDIRYLKAAARLLVAGCSPWMENAEGLTAVEVAAAQKHANLKETLETQADYVGVFSLPLRKTFGRNSSEEVFAVVAPRIPVGLRPSASRASLWLACYRNAERCKEVFRLCLAGASVTPLGAGGLVLRLGPGQALPKAVVGSQEVILSAVYPPAAAPCAPLSKLAEIITASGGHTPYSHPSQATHAAALPQPQALHPIRTAAAQVPQASQTVLPISYLHNDQDAMAISGGSSHSQLRSPSAPWSDSMVSTPASLAPAHETGSLGVLEAAANEAAVSLARSMVLVADHPEYGEVESSQASYSTTTDQMLPDPASEAAEPGSYGSWSHRSAADGVIAFMGDAGRRLRSSPSTALSAGPQGMVDVQPSAPAWPATGLGAGPQVASLQLRQAQHDRVENMQQHLGALGQEEWQQILERQLLELGDEQFAKQLQQEEIEVAKRAACKQAMANWEQSTQPARGASQAPSGETCQPRDWGLEDSLCCPILQEVMSDPVLLLGDGMTYERAAITQWLQRSPTSPMTGQRLSCTTLVPNHSLKSIIAQHLPPSCARLRKDGP